MNSLQKKLRQARLRYSLNMLLQMTGRGLILTAIAAILAILIERLLALDIIMPETAAALAGVATLLILTIWGFKFPSRMHIALLIDRRFQLHERFSTTLALAQSQHPFAEAARDEATQTAKKINLKSRFPIRPNRSWAWGAAGWLVAILLFAFLPPKDLLGFFHKKQQQQAQTEKIQQAQAQVDQSVQSVKAVVEQLDQPDLTEKLSKLDPLSPVQTPAEIKRQAIRKLGDIADHLKQLQQGEKAAALEMTKQMLKQLRSTPNALSQNLYQALAQGDFKKTAELVNQLQKQLAQGDLSELQKKELARQLKDLADQLAKLAQQNEQLEKELEKLGLDKKLAVLTEEQLKQTLQKKGLTQDQIENLLKKRRACRMACRYAGQLSQAMAACCSGGGGTMLMENEMADFTGQLTALESMQQQMNLVQAGLDQINAQMACLGQGMAKGLAMCPNGNGLRGGTTGHGSAPQDSDLNEDKADLQKTQVLSKSKPGPVIASWYFKDQQVKGQAERSFTEVVQAARDNAAEAITENQIPKRYETAVKNYFGQLENTRNP